MRVETQESLFLKVKQIAKIGTWEVDLVNDTVEWSKVTKIIHDVPDDYQPTVAQGISFYKQGSSRDTIEELFNRCISDHEDFDTELEIVTAKGKQIWVRAIGIPVVENNQCVKVYGLFQDIDEKTRMMKDLRIREEQFRRTFDYSGIGMALVSLTGQWLRVNDQLTEMLGYTPEEFLNLTFQDITHHEDLDLDLNYVRQMLDGTLDSYQMEKRYIHKSGDVVWALLSVSMVKDASDEPLHFVSQITNITERKEAEGRVEELLKVTNSQNERLLNFAHIVSHNLRSHSGNIRLLIDLIKEQSPGSTTNEFFPLLDEASGNLEETIEHLNEVAVINLKANENLQNLSLNEFVEKAVGNVRALLFEVNGKIENRLDQKFTVQAIPAYLESVVLNFLTNSIKYRSEDEKLEISIEARKRGEYIELAVEDNGRGIDLTRHRKKLFGMYKTFHKHEDARGIGLFITKNQVEAMGGKIDVRSTPGIGTTFYIYLRNEEN